MKNLVLIFGLLAMAGCTSRTPYGECIGITDEKNPKLEYSVSKRNVVLGFVFSETVVVPAIVLFTQLSCPVGAR